MTASLLVTGTDTGIGKTHVTVLLAAALAARGTRVAVMKPVSAGIEPGAAINDDVARLCAVANVAAPLADVNPFAYRAAIAPHVAARAEGLPIRIDDIVAAHGRLAARADCVLVEGAGGALVPLTGTECVLDLARALQAPVLLVVGVRLGCINHALLTIEAINARGLAFAGWIANRCDPAMVQADASIAAIGERAQREPAADVAFGATVLPPGTLARLGL